MYLFLLIKISFIYLFSEILSEKITWFRLLIIPIVANTVTEVTNLSSYITIYWQAVFWMLSPKTLFISLSFAAMGRGC